MSSTLRPARSGSSSPCRGRVWETPGVRMPPGRSIVWYQNVDATLARSSSTFTGGAAPLRRHRPVAVARGKTLYVFGANAEHTDRVERSGPLLAETCSQTPLAAHSPDRLYEGLDAKFSERQTASRRPGTASEALRRRGSGSEIGS